MNYVIVTKEWMAARNILPLPTMRKNRDGSKYLAHEDFFGAFRTKGEDGEETLDGLTLYPHNGSRLAELLASDEWSYGGEETSTESADYIQVAAVRNLMEATRANIQNYNLTGKEVNSLTDMLPEWEDLIGELLPFKFKLRYNNRPYRVNQAHTPQPDWKPDTARNLYGLISDHDGTLDDPIPYERWIVLEKGLYYTQGGMTYRCITDAANGYDADLVELGALVEKVD